MSEETLIPEDFDPDLYWELHPDVKAAAMDPKYHYLHFGMKEGRRYKRAFPGTVQSAATMPTARGLQMGATEEAGGPLKKTDIVHILVKRLGLRHYLELCTPSTGNYFHHIQNDGLVSRRRMMYIVPNVYDDGETIDFRSPDESIDRLIEDLAASGIPVDVCLIDGWHTYATSSRDLRDIYRALDDGGVMVVHDCLPDNREETAPRYQIGPWCGVSYKAFLEFVLRENSLDYFTVNCDYGCGVIIKNRKFSQIAELGADTSWQPKAARAAVRGAFLKTGQDFDKTYDVFFENRQELLRLVEPEIFEQVFGSRAGRSNAGQ